MAEIPLEEPVKKEKRSSYILLGIAIGLAIGIAVGYYVHTGTLQYAYKLLSEAQAPPPDIYLVAYTAGKSLMLTPMGTQLLVQPLNLNEKIIYVGDVAEYTIFISSEYVYVIKGQDIYTRLYIKGIKAASLMGNDIYVGAEEGVYRLGVPELEEKGSEKISDVRDLVAMPDENEVYVLTGEKLYVLSEDLEQLREFGVGGDKLFVGAYYFFVAKGNDVISFERFSGKQISRATVGGEVQYLRACRGIMLVVTADKTYALRVPDLSLIKTLDVGGLRVRADPTCSLVYIVGDSALHMILVPSLNVHTVQLDVMLYDVAVKSGASGVAVQLGGKRQIALACGG